eukprot:gene2931-33953_t
MVGDAASDENEILVVPSVLSDNLLIRPHCLGSDIDVHVQAELRRKVEGVCTRHGYILANSTSIHSISAARLDGIQASDGQFTPLLDAILVKDQHEGDLLEKLNGKRFEIGDNRISVVARLLADDDEFASDDDPTQPHVCFTRVVHSVLPVASLSKLRINNEHEGDDSEKYSVFEDEEVFFGDADEVDDQNIVSNGGGDTMHRPKETQ